MNVLLRRAWKYLVAWLGSNLDALADPRVQVEQALEEARRQHQLLTRQAAAVIGNQRELEIRLGRSRETAAGLVSSARRSLQLAMAARAAGDEDRAGSLEQAARAFAGRLAALESEAANLAELRERSLVVSAAARRAVEQNALALQRSMTERTTLLSELEAARMQERLALAIGSLGELAPAAEVPSLARVRDRIDSRFARATGAVELAGTSPDQLSIEIQLSTIDEEAERRLDEIRRGLD